MQLTVDSAHGSVQLAQSLRVLDSLLATLRLTTLLILAWPWALLTRDSLSDASKHEAA